MAADELLDAQAHRVGHLKAAFFGGDLRDHGDNAQHIAQLLGDMWVISGVHRFQRLGHLVEQKGARAGEGLLPIPGAAVGGAQMAYYFLQIGIAAVGQGGARTGRRRRRCRSAQRVRSTAERSQSRIECRSG